MNDKGFYQLVKGLTNNQNSTFDFKFTQIENINNMYSLEMTECNSVCQSDHYSITLNLNTTMPKLVRKVKVEKREYKNSV